MADLKRLDVAEEDSNLEQEVQRIINDNCEEGYGVESFIKDLHEGGCVSGLVGELVYYKDTVIFFETHMDEIEQLLTKALEESGANSPAELFGDKWDSLGPLAVPDQNENLLAWFAFEETARILADRAGIET